MSDTTMPVTLLYGFIVWIILAAFYLLFAGQISLSEIIAGLIATAIATTIAILAHRSRSRRLQPRAPWLHVISRSLAALLPDAWRVGGMLLSALWRRPGGSLGVIIRQPFRQGPNTAEDAGRRGLVTLSISLAPNGYVLRILDGQNELLLHRLASTASSVDREWPA